MYPSRDFRSLLSLGDSSAAIRAISREPFIEILRWWKNTGKPDKDLPIYLQGITEAVSRERYTCGTLDLVADFPEFHEAVSDGLVKLWCKLPFRLNFETNKEPYLTVDEKCNAVAVDPGFTVQHKIGLLRWIRHRMNIPMTINSVKYQVGIFMSRNAIDIFQRITWLCPLEDQS